MTDHQQKQIEVIDKIERQVNENALNFTTVAPVEDYENDPRICLTSVHFPNKKLIKNVEEIISELSKIESSFFYYPSDSLHMTIKNIRVINDPLHFTNYDIEKADKVFSRIIQLHKKFKVYFYRLLLFPNNLALIGTTDPELDEIALDLDQELNKWGVPDDKQYANSKYFFSNMTLARFDNTSEKFRQKVKEQSYNLEFEPYTVDSISLVTCNAVFKKLKIINSWKLG